MHCVQGPRHTDIITENRYVQSHFVRMAKMLNIGKKFEDFSSLEIAIQQYQKEENVKFFRRSARTIEKAQPRMPYKKLNERLKYYEISFHYIRGLSIYLFVLQVMTSKPSQHTMSDPHQSAHKMPFRWRAYPGPLFMFSFDVCFDIMPKSNIINFR